MKQLIWGMLLLSLAVYADVCVPLPWTPAEWNIYGNPAVKWKGLRLGFMWAEPMDGVDYEMFGFAAEWGTSRVRLSPVFVSSFLDSLYRSENFALDVSANLWRFTLGAGVSTDVQMVPGETTWWRVVGKGGVSVEWPAHIHTAFWTAVPNDFEENVGYAEFLWKPDENFQSELVLRFRKRDGVLVLLGQYLQLGAIGLQGNIAYPGPKVGVGIVCRIQFMGASFGVHRDADYMNSKYAGLYVTGK